MGPVITYMARCPDTGCQDWSPGTEYVLWDYLLAQLQAARLLC